LVWLFDMRVEASLEPALNSVADPDGSRSALRRRAEGYLETSVESVWLSSVGREITHEGLLRLLNAPYNERAGDRTVLPEHWDRLLLNLPGGDWPGACLKLRDRALAVIEQRADLRRKCDEAAERVLADTADVVAQRAARDGAESAQREQALGEALARGVRDPFLRVEACGVVLLTDRPLETEADAD
jgi:ATP-dependent helicase HepA